MKLLLWFYLRIFFGGFILMLIVYSFLEWARGTFDIKEVLLFSRLWGIGYALFLLLYYSYYLRKMGITKFDAAYLKEYLDFQKRSNVDEQRLLSKIRQFPQFRSYKINEGENSIMMALKFPRKFYLDPIEIKWEKIDSELMYSIKIKQDDFYNLENFYRNLKNLNLLSRYI